MSDYKSTFVRGSLTGQTAVITGGGSGIGYGIAQALAWAASTLTPLFLDPSSQTAVGISTDVRSEDALASAASHVADSIVPSYGPLTILINAAAGNFLALAEDLTPKGFATVLSIDTMGTFNTSSAFFDLLASSSPTHAPVVINISATLHKPATWYQSHASAAKAAIDSLTRSLALEWGAHGIRVMGVAPGPIRDTPGFAKLGGAVEAVYDQIADVVPLGRIGTVDDIGASILFLASPAAAWISGVTLVVDGGAQLWSPPILPRSAVADHSRRVERKSRATGLPLKSKL